MHVNYQDPLSQLAGWTLLVKVFTSHKFASALFEEVTLGPQEAMVTVATFVVPHTVLTFQSIEIEQKA